MNLLSFFVCLQLVAIVITEISGQKLDRNASNRRKPRKLRSDSSKSEEKDFVDKPDGVDCRSDRECRIGFVCSKSLGKCVKVGNVKFGGECEEKADCLSNMRCLENKCDTLGNFKDYCRTTADCKSHLTCNNAVCEIKKRIGDPCDKHDECLDSVCLEHQGPKIRGGEGNKHCGTVGARKGAPCDPDVLQCNAGLVCTSTKSRDSFQPREFQSRRSPRKQRRRRTKRQAKRESRRRPGSQRSRVSRRRERTSQRSDSRGESKSGESNRNRKLKPKPRPGYFCQDAYIFARNSARNHCERSHECRCGEYCHLRKQVCKVATCRTPLQCRNYPGFQGRMQCKMGMCVPGNNVLVDGFNNRFEQEGLRTPSPNATNTPQAG